MAFRKASQNQIKQKHNYCGITALVGREILHLTLLNIREPIQIIVEGRGHDSHRVTCDQSQENRKRHKSVTEPLCSNQNTSFNKYSSGISIVIDRPTELRRYQPKKINHTRGSSRTFICVIVVFLFATGYVSIICPRSTRWQSNRKYLSPAKVNICLNIEGPNERNRKISCTKLWIVA